MVWLFAPQPELHNLFLPHPHASFFTKFPREFGLLGDHPGQPVSASDQGAGAREDQTIGIRLKSQTKIKPVQAGSILLMGSLIR